MYLWIQHLTLKSLVNTEKSTPCSTCKSRACQKVTIHRFQDLVRRTMGMLLSCYILCSHFEYVKTVCKYTSLPFWYNFHTFWDLTQRKNRPKCCFRLKTLLLWSRGMSQPWKLFWKTYRHTVRLFCPLWVGFLWILEVEILLKVPFLWSFQIVPSNMRHRTAILETVTPSRLMIRYP